MGIFDKARHAGQDAAGKAKQGVGRARADKPMENQGKRERKTSQLKKAGDHVKDALKRK